MNFENLSEMKAVIEADQKKGKNFVCISTDPDSIVDIKTMCDEQGWKDLHFLIASQGAAPEDVVYKAEMFRDFAVANNLFVIMVLVMCESESERTGTKEILKTFGGSMQNFLTRPRPPHSPNPRP